MYPNEPCEDCPEEEVGIPLPAPCGDECAFVYDAGCVAYTGFPVNCETTPILTIGQSVQSALYTMAQQICSGVSGIAATLDIGTVTINQIDYDQPASGTIVNSGSTAAAILDITLNIPEGVPADAVNINANSTDSEIISVGSKIFTFPTPLIGPYIWEIGTRMRAFYDASNYMEGLVTAHTDTDVTINVDYIVGSGTYAVWDIFISGDVGSQGNAGTVTANTPATVNSVAWNSPAVVAVANSGTAENAILDFTFDIPSAIGVSSATINGVGELEITLDDASVLNAGAILPVGAMPIGGAANQVLTKQSGFNYDVIWATPDVSGWMPTGGAAGEFLVKNSATDYDALWVADPYLAPEPPVVASGFAIPIIHVTNEAEFLGACTYFNSDVTDRYGAIIHLGADITLTQDLIALNMSNIEVRGNRNFAFIHETAGTVYKLVLAKGSPIFKDVVFKNTTKFATNTGGVNDIFFELNEVSGTNKISVQFVDCIFENIAQASSATGHNISLVTGAEGSEIIIKGCSIITGLAADGTLPDTTIKMVINNTSWDGNLIIEDMKWLRATSKGTGTHTALAPNYSEYVSSIYFSFIGTWSTGPNNLLHIDMESYAYSDLNSNWGVSDSDFVYIKNSMFMYGDDDNTQVSLKPNGFGVFGWDNPSATHPLDNTDYA